MAEYQVTIARSAEKEINKLENEWLERIMNKLEFLSSNPRPKGSVKLEGGGGYRVRVGDYRIIYTIDDNKEIIDISAVRHRKEVYRKR